MRAVDLKALAKERGLRCHFRLRKAEVIELLRENDRSRLVSSRPPPQTVRLTWEPSRLEPSMS